MQPRMRRGSPLLVAALAAATMGMGTGMGLGGMMPRPRRDRELTEPPEPQGGNPASPQIPIKSADDLERIAKAQAKRERKAARRDKL